MVVLGVVVKVVVLGILFFLILFWYFEGYIFLEKMKFLDFIVRNIYLCIYLFVGIFRGLFLL